MKPTRRQMLACTATVMRLSLARAQDIGMTQRTYHILGVPLRTGSLYPGNENDAQAYREAQLVPRLKAAGCSAVDEGDLAIPSYLPHHSIPPIRNWPGPRIVWDIVSEKIARYLRQPGHTPLLVGCDCSIIVGTAQALKSIAKDVHVLYIDGDFDDAPPDASRCQSAASLAVWLLTNQSPFWAGPALSPSQVTVIGWTNGSRSKQLGIGSLSLQDVRRLGVAEAVRRAIETIPASASILIHLDIDVVRQQDMPAAYFPHAQGMNLAEMTALLGGLVKDPRIRIIEISEYSALRDLDQQCATKLVTMLADVLKS